jgi:hypothetical protein
MRILVASGEGFSCPDNPASERISSMFGSVSHG